MYTAVSGIWQTVWLEPVPADHIQSLKIVPDVDRGVVSITADASSDLAIRLTARRAETIVADADGRCWQGGGFAHPECRSLVT